MKTTLFDLIWKLKKALEAEGYESIDLQRFSDDGEYRRQILLSADSSNFRFSAGIREIYPDLLQEGALDLTKEVCLRQAAENDPDNFIPTLQTKAPKLPPPATRRGIGPPRGLLSAAAVLVLAGAFIGNQVLRNSDATASEVSTAGMPITAPAAPASDQWSETVLFRLHGSNTIGESLAPELLKAFFAGEGAEQIQLRKTAVEVESDLVFRLPGSNALSVVRLQAHGSSTGFKGLAGGVADLAMSSRRIKDEEHAQLSDRFGDLKAKGSENVIGMDGLAVIVHPANPLNHLSTAQLAQLFSGAVSNWSALGGPDLAVKLYARDANSGTWDSFQSLVLNTHEAKLAPHAVRIESSIELSDRVSKEPGAIGFIGLPYILRAKALAIADEANAQPIYPTSFTISTEDYPLVRRLYVYEPATVDSASLESRFIRFALSEQGQDVVKAAGFISQNISKTRPALSAELPPQYLQLVRGAERLSLNFRFNSGTTELDNKAQRDLDRVVKYFEDNPGQAAILIGFSDSIGEPAANRQLSLARAHAVEQALFARGISVRRVEGLGEAVPIASNITKAGRDRNRRVEIWVQAGAQFAAN